jgi:hypothetical protein
MFGQDSRPRLYTDGDGVSDNRDRIKLCDKWLLGTAGGMTLILVNRGSHNTQEFNGHLDNIKS